MKKHITNIILLLLIFLIITHLLSMFCPEFGVIFMIICEIFFAGYLILLLIAINKQRKL